MFRQRGFRPRGHHHPHYRHRHGRRSPSDHLVPARDNDGAATTRQPPTTTPPPADCGISQSNDVITAPISTLEPPSGPTPPWSTKATELRPLRRFKLRTPHPTPKGTSQSGSQIPDSHHDEYDGIYSTYPQQAMNIEDKGNALVVVTYKDGEALDDAGCSNAGAPNYPATGIFFRDETTNQLG